MHENLLRTDWLQAKRRLTDVGDVQFYDLKFVAFPVFLEPLSERTQEQTDIQSLLIPATFVESLMARIRVFNAQRNAAQETKQQREALSTWEDEGGTATKAVPIRRVAP